MTTAPRSSHFRPARIGRILLRTGIALLALLLLLVCIVAVLPSVVSSQSGQSFLRQRLSKSLKRDVRWTELAVSWRDGLKLRGLVLDPGPAPLLRGTVGDAVVSPSIRWEHGRPRVDLVVRLADIAADLAPGPSKPKPPKPYKEPLTALADGLQQLEKMDLPLPLDLGVQTAVGPADITYTDPASGRKMTVGKASLRLDMPSLADKPLTAECRADVAVDGKPLKALSLAAKIDRLVTPGRRIRPAGAIVAVDAALPGTDLAVRGGLLEPGGVKGGVRVDLQNLAAAVGPFLRPGTPAAGGLLFLDLQATADRSRDLHADLALKGEKLTLAGGKLGNRRIGPLELRLQQKVVSDHRRQQVRFVDGKLAAGKLLDAAWGATVDRPASRDRELTAALGPVRLDLGGALELARPLLTRPLPVTDLAGELKLERLEAKLQGERSGNVALQGLRVDLPRLRVENPKGKVTVDGISIGIDRAVVPLASMRPTSADAELSYAVAKGAVAGKHPSSLSGLQGEVKLALKDIGFTTGSPLRVSATAELAQKLALRSVAIEGQAGIDALQERLAATVRLADSGAIEATIPELRVAAAAVRGKAGGKELRPLPLSALVTATGIKVVPGAGPSVEKATCAVTGGDFVQLAAAASLSGRRAATQGGLRVDLDRGAATVTPFLPKGAAVGGVTAAAWDLSAPLDMKPPAKEKNPLKAARAALALLDRADLTLTLANRGIAWPLADGSVKVADLRTTKPVRLVLPGKGKLRLEGELAFGGVSGLPGAAGTMPPQSGTVSLQGELADWQSAKLHEELQLMPLGFSQRGDVALGRLDALMEQAKITPPIILQRLDATVTSQIAARFPATPTPVPGGISVSGGSSAELRVALAAGRELRVRGTAATKEFGVRLKNGTAVEGMNGDILFDRTYALARGGVTGWTPLSASLVRPAPDRSPAAVAAELASRVREDLRGQEEGSRRFTIRRIVVPGGKVPLELASLEGDLLMTPEELGLSFLQTEALGGTARLRGIIDLRPELPALSAACSFSNLQTAFLLPAEVRQKNRISPMDTAITGEVSVDAPLATGERELLEGLRMRLNLRRIGRDTLERALFSLDPYERNEQLVSQRKLLRNGSLKWLRGGTLDGSFSLDGEVLVKGISITLPPVERIRLADLQLRKEMAKAVAGVAALRKGLELVRADTLVVGEDGKISLVRRGNE